MASYVISTDTSCDFPLDYVQRHQIPLVSLYYSIDGKDGVNGCPKSEELKTFYQKMREGAETKTQQASVEDTEKLFRQILETGSDVLHIAFSSGLSGTANAARLAAETLREEFPDRKIIVIDSLCASLGQGLLVDYALRMKDEGKSMEETAQWVQDHLQNICHLFTVDDLKYLQRGGRISKTTALLGTMIGIKPVLHVDEEGTWQKAVDSGAGGQDGAEHRQLPQPETADLHQSRRLRGGREVSGRLGQGALWLR